MKKSSILISLLFFIGACKKHDPPAIAFYYWKTVFKLSPIELSTLENNQVKKLYIRYFDIDIDSKSNQPYPESTIHFEQKINEFTIVPVVFIKNKVFLEKNCDITNLAKKTCSLIEKINTNNGISCEEIQIDCDWTLSSRDNYLKFISNFKILSGKKLSATIRLHQIKYFEKTKIPNVDKGVLMYYNMGKIASDTINSIYDRNIANNYIGSIKNYPLSINIALPIFSWGIHIRDGKVIELINKLDINKLYDKSYFKVDGKNRFQVIQDNYTFGTFYKSGDIIKFEIITPNELIEMSSDLYENAKEIPEEIIFYDLDEFNIKKYENDIYKKVASRF